MTAVDPLSYITWCIFAAFVIAVIVLVCFSIYVSDTAFILAHPLKFLLELFVVSVVPAAVFAVLIVTRDADKSRIFVAIAVLAFKFAVLHILLQTSGYYKHLFDSKK